jgi:hypothetical protein
MSSVACDYYTRKADAMVWAIKPRDGRPGAAVGPLEPSEVGDNPVAHDFQRRAQNARHWNLKRDFIARGRKWVRFGPQLRKQPRTTFQAGPRARADGVPRLSLRRTFAPGFILPGAR